LPPMGKDVYCRQIRFFRRQSVGGESERQKRSER